MKELRAFASSVSLRKSALPPVLLKRSQPWQQQQQARRSICWICRQKSCSRYCLSTLLGIRVTDMSLIHAGLVLSPYPQQVLGNLSAPDLRRTTLVASPLHRAVKENASLQYILQCFKHGVVDCYPLDRSFPLSSLDAHASSETEPWTVSQKLNRLLERERKLTSLATDEQVVQVQGPCPIYELQPGVFVRGSDFVPSPGSHSDRPTSLEVYSLPTSGNGKESQYNRPAEVGVHTLNFDIGPYLDLTLDPTQNLVCIIKRSPGSSDAPTEMEVDSDQEDAPESGEQQPTQPTAGPNGCPTPSQVSGKNATYEVHLFDMAGNRRTDLPSSCLGLDNIDYASHLMQAAMAAHVRPARFLLQISGDTLGILVGGSEEGERDLIHCWNWRTGKDLCVSSLSRYLLPLQWSV